VSTTATKTQTEERPSPMNGHGTADLAALEVSSPDRTRYLRLFWDNRRLFWRSAVAALAVFTLLAFLIPVQYTSTTQLMPPDSHSNPAMSMIAALFSKSGTLGLGGAGDLLNMKSSGSLFIGVLRSHTSQERLIDQFDLRKVYGKRLLADARDKLDERTAISEDRKSGIITISVIDRSPQRAQALASAYVDELNTLVASLSTSAAHRERVFLESRLEVVKHDLDEASNQLAQFSSKNSTLELQQEGKALLDVASNLAGQLVAAEAQLEGLRQIYTDSNPRVRSLNARVAELRRTLSKVDGHSDKSTADPTQQLDSNAPATSETAKGDMPYPSIRNLPLLGVHYTDYYRRAKIQETVFELLTQQYELAKMEEAKEIPSVKVLDPAIVPEKKSFPPRLLIIALGLLLTMIATTIFLLGRARWAQVDPQEPQKILANEVLHSFSTKMPWAPPNGSPTQAWANRMWVRLVEKDSVPKTDREIDHDS
jgi:uncharacterized protein involved in exopolysaccharide biosynthesis